MKKLVILIFLLSAFLWSGAQGSDFPDSEMFRSRVKLVSEFMERFNGAETDSTEQQRKDLCQLFDIGLIAKNPEENERMALSFVDSVVGNGVKLHFADAEWFARAKCVGKFRGEEVTFHLLLTVEPRGNDMYKWVIAGAEGPIFELQPSRKSEKVMLFPNEHESDFMRLSQITTEKDDYITLYSSSASAVDPLTVFDTLIYYGYLDIEYVAGVEYTFLQVPGYSFTIREHERESSNSGWLISEWHEMTAQEKEALLSSLYRGKYPAQKPVKKDEAKETGRRLSETENEAIVKSFVGNLNRLINDKSAADSIRSAVKGRYTFTAKGELIDRLAAHFHADLEQTCRIDSIIEWLGDGASPVRSITVADIEPFVNENVKPSYASKFTMIKAVITTTGEISLTEPVIFLLSGSQIAGVRPISACFE